jgi:DNA-binding XRE family transcriptional regulator
MTQNEDIMNNQDAPPAVSELLALLGDDLRSARKVRKMPLEEMAARVGVTRKTIARMESGDPGVSIGIFVKAAWTLDLEANLRDVFAPERDHAGLRAARLSLPQRVRGKAEPTLGDMDF